MHFTHLLLLTVGAFAFTVPDGTTNGVYEVYTYVFLYYNFLVRPRN